MISMDKKYTTKDGRPVRLLCVDGPGEFPVIGLLESLVRVWKENGFYSYCNSESSFDLIEAKTKRTGWINIYKAMGVNGIWATKKEAEAFANASNIACIQIEWEE